MSSQVSLLKSPLLRNLLLAFASLLSTLLVFEAAFRVLAHLENCGLLDSRTPLEIKPPTEGPAGLGHMIRMSENRRIIYELKPDLDVRYSGARVRTDAHGFRSSSSPEELDRAGYRIVGIGDSFMFGLGVEQGEPYLAVLEKRLRAEHPELDARILNAAVPGYNTVMEVETLREKLLSHRPDLVIIEFVGNDLHLPNFIRRKNDVLAVDTSFLVEFFKRRLTRGENPGVHQWLAEAGLEPGLRLEEEDRVPAEYRDMVGFQAYIRTLRELQELSREHSFDVLSMTLASPRPFHTDVMTVSVDLGFHTLHVGEAFERYLHARGFDEYLGSPLALSATDGHPSAQGHRVAAAKIYRYLVDYVLPQPPSG